MSQQQAKHTPGPWHWNGNTLEPVEKEPGRSAVYSILDAEGGYGFIVSDPHATQAELEADRTLIAAAPELLDAVEAAEAVLGRRNGVAGSTDPKAVALSKLRAAIAKATGSAA